MKKLYLCFLTFFLITKLSYSVTYTSTGCPGPVMWGGFSTSNCPFWNGGSQLTSQPAAGDILVIPAGCTVTINDNITVTNSITINIYGQLKFNTSSDKLNLAAGSQINVFAGGSISGGSASNQISIGTGPAEWEGPATSTGPFTITNGNSTLPIELIEFYGTCLTNSVQLNWSTATETDNEYFLIEKSTNGAEWQFVAKVMGNGTTGTVHEYIHTDSEVNYSELVYYRLSQVDKNQTKTIFKAIDMNCSNNIPDQMVLFSNPASTELNLMVSVKDLSENNSIKVLDNFGESVMDAKINLTKGLNTFIFPIDIAPGIYHIFFSSDKVVLPSQKLLIIK